VKVVLVGAGAVGTLLGALLSGAGHSVTLVARGLTATAIAQHGVRVETLPPRSYPVDATVELPPGGSADLVIVAVKAFDVASAADLVGRALPPTPLVLLQNGLGIEAMATPALRRAGWREPERWIVRAVSAVPATWVAPGVVRPGGVGEILLASSTTAGPARSAVDRAAEVFVSAGIPVRRVEDLPRETWRKAVLNAAINPVTALRDVPNGALLEGPARAEALPLLEEARRAARAAGFEFTEAETLATFDRLLHGTAANRSSMLQDLDRGRPTEIDAISGEVLRAAEAHGLDLPATRAVVGRVRARAPPRADRAQPS
jgi:2-dehydropantoate 2-reductase